MRRTTRYLSCVLIFAMLISFAVPVSASGLPFTDVPENHVMYDAIKYVYDHGLMNGATATTFNPSGSLMRAMIVTILWRHAGEPVGYVNPGFTDVETTDFFYDAVCWAAELGITAGTTATTFEPYRELTIQETIIFLYRYALHEECGNMTYILPDPTRMTRRIGEDGYSYTIAPVAYDAVNWAVNCGIVADFLTYFEGTSITNRALCANYLYKFLTLAFGEGKVFSITTSYSCGPVESISNSIEDMGYDATIQYDLYPIALLFSFYNSDIIYTHSHGFTSGNGLSLAGENGLYKGDIGSGSMRRVELAYISACCAGNDFLRTLSDTGQAQACVGFSETIAAPVNDPEGGVYYFNKVFFEYLSYGYSLEMCKEKALEAMAIKYGTYLYGTDSCVIYGDFN